MAGAFAAGGGFAQTLPSGGVAVHGQAVISQPAPNKMVVTTHNGAGTAHSAINWQSFSISAGSSANFVQPSSTSTAINRVVTNTPSAIFGNLSSNGRLVLVNQSGIAVGAGAVVDTAGFTASALRMTDADALAGRLRFGDASADKGGAALTVDGRITAHDGDVVLIAPNIDVGTSAVVRAPNGSTVLAAGQQVEITGRGLEGIALLVQAPDDQARNLGRLEGNAVGIFAGTLRHSGEIQATAATIEGGRIVLKAVNKVSIDASAVATGSNGKGGQVHVTANDVALGANTVLDASGAQGGGEILVGGGWQGKDERIANARRTTVAAGAELKADATVSGNGGKVVVWANDTTRFAGAIRARGGPAGGDGGQAEVSGKQVLNFQGQVDLRAPKGLSGALLLDPLDIFIGNVADANGDDVSGDDVTGNIASGDFLPLTSSITAAQVSSLLNTTSLTLAATNNIFVDSAITKISGGLQTLTLDAGNDIFINAPISGSATAPLGLTLFAGGNIDLARSINTFGGDFTVTGSGASSTTTVSLGTVNAAKMTLTLAGELNLLASSDGEAELRASGDQTVSAAGISLGFLDAAGSNAAAIKATGAGSTQSITITNGADFVIAGGSSLSGGNSAIVSSAGISQTVNFIAGGNLLITGGAVGSGHHAELSATAAGSSQSITGATSIFLTGGASGGGAGTGTGNHATLAGNGNQSITVGDAGLTLTGGGGSGSDTGNSANVAHKGGAGTSQTITINGIGFITATGGSSTLTGVGDGNGSHASIRSDGGDSQTIVFTGSGAGRTIDLTGGTAGSDAYADIDAFIGTQSITGASLITLTGGASGGGITDVSGDDHGNIAAIGADLNPQTIVADGIILKGGLGGNHNLAVIYSGGDQNITVGSAGLQLTGGSGGASEFLNGASVFKGNDVAGTNQTITVGGGGAITLQGGSSSGTNVGSDPLLLGLSNGSIALIRSDGDVQLIEFTAPGGGISATGGTVGSNNTAHIESTNGTQTIQGSAPANAPTISLAGGADGGVVNEDNSAKILAGAGLQTINAKTTTLQTGGGPIDNSSTIVGSSQLIDITGDLSLTGGSSTSNIGGSRIGGRGNSNTNLDLTVSGNLTLTAGSTSGVALGSSSTATGKTNAITIATGGDVVLNPGVAQGVRIGSPGSDIQGGSISVSAGGNFIMNTAGGAGAANIRSLGDVSLSATNSGKSIFEAAGSRILANQLTASSDAGINLDSFNNQVTTFSAINPGTGTNNFTENIVYTQKPGTLLTINSITLGGANFAIINADDIDITGPVSAPMGIVTLRPADLTRDTRIENSPSAGVLSLSPADLRMVTASNLDIGALVPGATSAGSVRLIDSLADGDILADNVRIFSSSDFYSDSGANIGSALVPFNHNLTLHVLNAVQLTNGNLFLANNRSFGVFGNIGGSDPAGSIDIGAVTLRVGLDAGNTSGNMELKGTDITIDVSGGARGLVEVKGSGNQTFTSTVGDINFWNSNTGGFFQSLDINIGTGVQTISAANLLSLRAGTGDLSTVATNTEAGGSQVVTAAQLEVIGGSAGTNNEARLYANGSQTVTIGAGGIDVRGGNGDGNFGAIGQLASVGSQSVDSAGDITLTGGSGPGANNSAQILNSGSGGQTMSLGVAATLTLQGGAGGSGNSAKVTSFGGAQTITGASGITITGGASGGVAGVGNSANINSQSENQTISADAIALMGGAGGTENLAQIRQGSASGGLGATQSINLLGGGPLTLDGGAGASNFASVQAFGTLQSVNMVAGAALGLTGGTGASSNFARIHAVNGNQTITGAPDITLNGGASGGADLAGNSSDIRASGASSVQTIAAGNITLQAGAAGQENFAGMLAPNQTITALGGVLLTGGGSLTSLDGTSGGGARIGGLAGGVPSATNLTLSVGNDLVLTGGSVSGASLGSNRVGGQITNIIVDADGDITLNPGSVATAGSRIGSPIGGLAGGDIFLASLGSIVLNGATAGETAVRTLGDVTLDAAILSIGNQVRGATIFANASGPVSIAGVGQLNATALTGDSIEVVTGSTFTNSAGASALVTTAPARWLVYSNDPANDNRGALVYDFKQYAKTFGDANPVLGAGNGFLYTIAPTAAISLTGSVSKVYDGTDVATVAAGNFLATGGVDGDVVSVSGGAFGNYDTRHVGSGKTVSTSGVTIDALDGAAPVFGYALAGGTATGAIGAITAAPLTVSTVAVTKTYDGTTSAIGTSVVTSGTLSAGDSLSGGIFAFQDRNAGTGKTVNVSGVAVNDGNSGLNYTLTQADNTSSSISAASLTLGTSDVIKAYGGNTSALGSLVVTGGTLFGSDAFSGGSFAFTNKNAGIGNKVVTVGGATVSDGNGGANYTVGYTNNTTSTINKADITGVSGIVASNKVYDGNTSASLITSAAGFTGIVSGDTLTVASATGSFGDRNVGTAKPVNISSIALGGTDAINYNLTGSTTTSNANITQASLTVSTAAVTKTYDGTTSAIGASVVTSGTLFAGDSLGGGIFAFQDRNAGTGKTVNVSGVTVNDGNSGGNYLVSFTSNVASSITALATATWTGSVDTFWSNPANWVAATVPELSNVQSVVIPAGTGVVVFDADAGTTMLQSLNSQQAISVTGGSLQLGTSLNTPSLSLSGGDLQVGTTLITGSLSQSAGTLQVGTGLSTASFSQSGGAITGTGAMAVTGSFNQSAGSLSMGSININQASGNLVFANLSAPAIALSAPGGMIGQTGRVGGGALTTNSLSGTLLNNASNQIGTLVATNAGSGNVTLVNSGALSVGTITNAGGNINVTNTGAVMTIGPVTAPAGNVSVTANSPLTVGAGGIAASGDIVLQATNLTSAGNMTLNGPVLAGNTVNLAAGSNLVQNFAVVGAFGVTASAAGSMTFGPLATTNFPTILYTAGGVPVTPPPSALASTLQAPGDIIVTFLDLFRQAVNTTRGELLETNADGSKKDKDLEGVVTEGEVCR
jgi:filamentous hemagglutinin family protein